MNYKFGNLAQKALVRHGADTLTCAAAATRSCKLPPSLVPLYKPSTYQFEGQEKGRPYTSISTQLVLKQAAWRAGTKRPVPMHSLRHSYATHLLDRGANIRYIQELLGHKDIKTASIYTHVTTKNLETIHSPLDHLPLGEESRKKRPDDTESVRM